MFAKILIGFWLVFLFYTAYDWGLEAGTLLHIFDEIVNKKPVSIVINGNQMSPEEAIDMIKSKISWAVATLAVCAASTILAILYTLN